MPLALTCRSFGAVLGDHRSGTPTHASQLIGDDFAPRARVSSYAVTIWISGIVSGTASFGLKSWRRWSRSVHMARAWVRWAGEEAEAHRKVRERFK